MNAELISIGDELLIGQTVNTNAAWLGTELSLRGFLVNYSCVISDDADAIVQALDEALRRVDLIIITGGLGPTKDDITKKVLANYFGSTLIMHPEILERIENYFELRGREMLETNRLQAMLPEKAKILMNTVGTASGMWFEKDGKVVISLPGVPYEMKHILEEEGFPALKTKFNSSSVYYRTVLTQGIGESYLAERISDIENQIREEGLSLAYLPNPGLVRLRVTAIDTEEGRYKVDNYCKSIYDRLPAYAFGMDDEELSGVVGRTLSSQGYSLGTIESCTGGSLAAELVKIPGSSAYFMGSIISYSNELKMKLVAVDMEVLEAFGAVSQETVEQMASKGRQVLGADYVMATSGIAGPTGGSDTKPVGTVWIAIAGPKGVTSKKFNFGNDRERTIRQTVLTALNFLRCDLLQINL